MSLFEIEYLHFDNFNNSKKIPIRIEAQNPQQAENKLRKMFLAKIIIVSNIQLDSKTHLNKVARANSNIL